MQKQVWLLSILSAIIIILIAILILVPANFKPTSKPLTKTGLVITSRKANAEVSSPIKITGYVNGDGWSGFEGQVGSVSITWDDGIGGRTTIGPVPLTATTEWTKLPTSFTAVLPFIVLEGQKANNAELIFKNENPSGLPERDKTFTLPVKLSENNTIKVEVFFGNSVASASDTNECSNAYRVDHDVAKTSAVAEVAINELLRGPTATEKEQGYFTSIPAASKLNSISIVNGEARADFNETTESGGGSCSMVARVAQITQTLKQFPTITSVKLSINGRTGDIFQP